MIIEPLPTEVAQVRPAGRIRRRNEQAIICAAEAEFARHGYKGASMNAIALAAGLPKANLHYYFTNKLGLYVAVLKNILDLWDSSFSQLSVADDPAVALSAYIRTKVEFSRRRPLASRVFAMEIISGGEHLDAYFGESHQQWFKRRAAVFQSWIDSGRMDPVDPTHLIFLIWSSTQHYADFSAQVCLFTGKRRLQTEDYQQAADSLVQVILKGCGLTPQR
jgi:TetR/AcrR family transcriptional regulator